MKINLTYLKSHYPILLIKLVILSLFIIAISQGVGETMDLLSNFPKTERGFETYHYALTVRPSFRPAIILLIPCIGILTNKIIGWILIQSYFYFLLTNLTFTAVYIDFKDVGLIISIILIFLVLTMIIVLMSTGRISNKVYGIQKSELIGKNIIASVIGISITIILALIKPS